MFICAYRSNEVDAEHPLQKVIDEVCHEQSEIITSEGSNNKSTADSSKIMELYPLPQKQIQRFISDSLSIPIEEASELTQVIYTKTMGNIFYVRQAMEELVRKNALYYDVMLFCWSFSGGDGGGGKCKKELLENYVSNDVLESVRGKIDQLSENMQQVLKVMAYIPNNALSTETLRTLLNSTGVEIGDELTELLNCGIEEGVLLLSSSENQFIFSHDKVREAAKLCVKDEDRDDLLLLLANALLALYKEGEADTEWCIFVGLDYLNSFEAGTSKFDALELAQLNLKVAKLAMKKGAMEKQHELLGNGIRCLDSANKLWVEYELTLVMYNALIEVQYFLGEF
jgi:predicted ATPase